MYFRVTEKQKRKLLISFRTIKVLIVTFFLQKLDSIVETKMKMFFDILWSKAMDLTQIENVFNRNEIKRHYKKTVPV